MSVDSIMKEVNSLISVYRNPSIRQEVLDRIRQKCAELELPKEPPPELIDSMCLRYAHDFWLDKDPDAPLSCGWTDEGRESLRRTMRQLYEEVSGHGFFKWSDVTKA